MINENKEKVKLFTMSRLDFNKIIDLLNLTGTSTFQSHVTKDNFVTVTSRSENTSRCIDDLVRMFGIKLITRVDTKKDKIKKDEAMDKLKTIHTDHLMRSNSRSRKF